MEQFSALRIYQDDKGVEAKVETLDLDDLNDGEVVIKVAWSCINYKDALAVTGAGKILRRSPLVGGIDVAGTVVSSSDNRYQEGDEVVVTSAGLGETHDGGYAEYARLTGDSVIPLPAGFSMRDAMALGTAGFTAALGLVLEGPLDRRFRTPDLAGQHDLLAAPDLAGLTQVDAFLQAELRAPGAQAPAVAPRQA